MCKGSEVLIYKCKHVLCIEERVINVLCKGEMVTCMEKREREKVSDMYETNFF